MTQIEAMVVVMGVGFTVGLFICFLPNHFSLFRHTNAKMYFGVGIGMLLLNLWPVFSSEVLINRRGDEIYPFPYAYLTVLGFLFFLILAIRAENKSKKGEAKYSNGVSTSITTLAWFLVLTSFVSLVSLGKAYIGGNTEVIEPMKAQSALPLEWQYIHTAASGIINLLCAVMIFKAHPFGRSLFAGWTSFSFVVAFVSYADNISMIWSLIFYVVFIAILFSPKGDEYFHRVKQ